MHVVASRGVALLVGGFVLTGALTSALFDLADPSPPLPGIADFATLSMTWSLERVDADGTTGYCPSIDLSEDAAQAPMIAYVDIAAHPVHRARFAAWNGTAWANETVAVDEGIWCPRLGVDSPRITMALTTYVPWHNILQLADRTADTWSFRTIDNATGGLFSLTVLPDGRRAIAYPTFDEGGYDGVLLALENGVTWEIITVVSPTTYDRSIDAIDVTFWNGTFAIAYLLADGSSYGTDVMVAIGAGTTWRVETAARDVSGTWPERWVAFDSRGGLHLLYGAANSTTLNYAHRDSGWTTEEIDRGTGSGAIVYYALAMGPDDRPRTTYHVGDPHRFMYAERGPSGWMHSMISNEINFGSASSIAVDRHGYPHVAFLDVGWPQHTHDLWYATGRPTNLPPTASLAVPAESIEGSPMTFDASASFDPEGAPLQFRWDFDADGTWETSWSSDSTATFTWGDDWTGMARVEVSDGEFTDTAEAPFVVRNAMPTMTASVTVQTNDPRTQGYWNQQCRQEEPPSPDHVGIQQSYVDDIAAHSRVFAGIATKDQVCAILGGHGDDSRARAELQLMALWLNVASEKLAFETSLDLATTDAETVAAAIANIEDVLRDPDAAWDSILRGKDVADAINNGRGVAAAVAEFTAVASDPGSDDLTFTWDFGDGSVSATTYYNDGVSPDPFPSPEVNPITARDVATHSYAVAGTYTVMLTVTDDDGGIATTTILVSVGG